MLKMKYILYLILSIFIVGCTSDVLSEKDNVDDRIILGLSALNGKYIWHDELNKYIFSKKVEIESLLSENSKFNIVRILANCIDDISLSNSILNDHKVKLGILCYEALSQTIYYEPILPNGDIALKWGGHISPDATESDMKAAKRAWNDVITLKKYKSL